MELFLADWLVTDAALAPRQGAGIAVHDGRIAAVGSEAELRATYPEAPVSRGSGQVLLPGLINSHCHMYGVLAHGVPIRVPFQDFRGFLEVFWWPYVEDRLDHNLVEIAARWACLELIESGCTLICDILEGPNAIPGALDVEAAVLEAAGLRGVLSFESTERLSRANGQLGLQENADFCRRQRRRGSAVGGMQCIHTTFSCSAGFLAQASDLARADDTGLQLHISESVYEPQWCQEHYGTTPVEYYDRLGFWGPHVLASQCVQMQPHELDILAASGVRVSHMPLSNCEVGGGVAPVPDMLGRGMTVGIGTDGYINNLFELMRGAFLIHKAHRQSTTVMPAQTVLQLATAGGAAAGGRPDLGRLRPGAPADFIRVGLNQPTPVAEHNFFDQIVLYCNPHDVADVVVGGRWLKRQGGLLTVDAEKTRAEVRAAADRLWR